MSETELPETDQAADERTTLLQFLDFYRAIVRRKAEGLTAGQMSETVASSSLTIGSITKHLARVEDFWLTMSFAGAALSEPWNSAPWDDEPEWDLTSARDDTPDELLDLFDAACSRSRRILDQASLDDQAALPSRDNGTPTLRWILVHLIEEYARHAGHLDFLREAVDGSVGD